MAGLALSSIINTLARVTVDRCVKVVESREKREESTEYINLYGSPVPWKRTSIQNYLYGSKKVIVKYIRQNLVIKVGGGSMMIAEFVATYEDIELAKMEYYEQGATGEFKIGHSQSQGLSHVERIALARGSSPNAHGSPARKLAYTMNHNLAKMIVGQGGHI